jgi:hypothetical protein
MGQGHGESKKDKKEKEDVHQKALHNLTSVLKKTATQSVELLDVLNAAEGYLDKNSSESKCPVCEQYIDVTELRKRLNMRAGEMKDLTQAVECEKSALEILGKSQTLLNKQWKLIVQSAYTLITAINQCSLDIVEPYYKTEIGIEHLSFTDEVDPVLDESLTMLLEEKMKETETWRIVKRDTQKSIDQNKLIKVSLKAYLDNINNVEELEKLCESLKKAHVIHEQVRKSEIDRILASLSGDIDSLYRMLHPDEKIGTISLYLKENARASLELGACFENLPNIPPHAYYSESHIDTLGICIFLALARFNNAEVVILDDVLTSVDSQHLNRFIEMLTSITRNYRQIIVTTHYRVWRERYRTGREALSNTQVIELGKWTLINGIRTRAFRTELELLKIELQKDDFDRQVIASKSGVILESILAFLTLTYHLKVRRNHRHEYSLGELADSFDKVISANLRIMRQNDDSGRGEIRLASMITTATALPWVRNCVGCHFQDLGSDTSDNDVLQFGQAVVDLADAIVCPTCFGLPLKKVNGSHWECKCQNGSIIMQPLEHP